MKCIEPHQIAKTFYVSYTKEVPLNENMSKEKANPKSPKPKSIPKMSPKKVNKNGKKDLKFETFVNGGQLEQNCVFKNQEIY
jgi:hypothetical protein